MQMPRDTVARKIYIKKEEVSIMDSQVVAFELAGVRYGIDIIHVSEIMRMVELTPVAEAEMSVEGIINLRGQVIPVVNLCRRLGIPERDITPDTRIVVAELDGKKAGLIVDRVLEVEPYILGELENPSGLGANITFLKGIIKKDEHLCLVLNLSGVA